MALFSLSLGLSVGLVCGVCLSLGFADTVTIVNGKEGRILKIQTGSFLVAFKIGGVK